MSTGFFESWSICVFSCTRIVRGRFSLQWARSDRRAENGSQAGTQWLCITLNRELKLLHSYAVQVYVAWWYAKLDGLVDSGAIFAGSEKKYNKLVKFCLKNEGTQFFTSCILNCFDHSCDSMWPYVYGWTIAQPIFSALAWDCLIVLKWPYRVSFCVLLSKFKCEVNKVRRKTFEVTK